MAFYFCLEGGEMIELRVFIKPKSLRETLCLAQSLINRHAPRGGHLHSDYLQELINECDRHRPLNAQGKHANLHTNTCGCEDK